MSKPRGLSPGAIGAQGESRRAKSEEEIMGLKIPNRVHLIGIGGRGMRQIAKLLLDDGKVVTGSDAAESEATERLREQGAHIAIGHRPEQVEGAELVIISTAIGGENPELIRARELQIPVVHRSDIWALLLNGRKGIAVAGAHGKTTVTSMIAWVLHRSGLDPTFLIGGEIPGLGGGLTGKSDWVVAEADESDGSFLRYRPWCSVVTNIEPDHLENFGGSFERLVEVYRQYLQNTRPDGVTVLCIDDELLRAEIPRLPSRCVSYGFDAAADWSAAEIELHEFRSSFVALHGGRRLGTVRLSVPGRHNVQNALAVLAVAAEVGLPFDVAVEHLASFRGAGRRFETVVEHDDILVIDDYAHHPSEIRATLGAARRGWPGRRLIAVFQPHRYTRTRLLFDEFTTAFGDADLLVLTEVYSPHEKPIPGINSEALARAVRRESPHLEVHHVERVEDVADLLDGIAEAGDLIITMGSGDIWRAARALRERLLQR